jgi:hypothetical protein
MSRPKATIEQVRAALGLGFHGALSLSDLNARLREAGVQRLTEDGALGLGLALRRRLAPGGKVRNIIVGLTQESVDEHWCFASERAE